MLRRCGGTLGLGRGGTGDGVEEAIQASERDDVQEFVLGRAGHQMHGQMPLCSGEKFDGPGHEWAGDHRLEHEGRESARQCVHARRIAFSAEQVPLEMLEFLATADAGVEALIRKDFLDPGRAFVLIEFGERLYLEFRRLNDYPIEIEDDSDILGRAFPCCPAGVPLRGFAPLGVAAIGVFILTRLWVRRRWHHAEADVPRGKRSIVQAAIRFHILHVRRSPPPRILRGTRGRRAVKYARHGSGVCRQVRDSTPAIVLLEIVRP